MSQHQPYSIGWIVNRRSQLEFNPVQKLISTLKEKFHFQIQILDWNGIESDFSFQNSGKYRFDLILLPIQLYGSFKRNQNQLFSSNTIPWVGYSMESEIDTPSVDLNNQDKSTVLYLSKFSISEVSQLLTTLSQGKAITQAPCSSNPIKSSQKPRLKLMVNPDFQESKGITPTIFVDELRSLLEEFQEKYFQAKLDIRKLDIQMKALEDQCSNGKSVDVTEIKELYLKIEAYNSRLKYWLASLLKPVAEYKKSNRRKRRKSK